MLPVVQLQIAWLKYGNQWIKDYPKIEAPNPGYRTVSVGVPPTILFHALGQELRVCFKPFELETMEQVA